MMVEITCPYCRFSKDVSEGKVPKGVRWATCPRCRQRFEFPDRGLEFSRMDKPDAPIDEGQSGEFSTTGEAGKGFIEIFRDVLFSPTQLFRTMDCQQGLKEPAAFGLLFGSIGTLVGFFWQFLMMLSGIFTFGRDIIGDLSISLIFLAVMIAAPFYVLIKLFVVSGILHLCLLIVGDGRNGFEGTFRVLSFAKATQVFLVVPVIGGIVGFIWHVVVQFIGLREIHETSYTRIFLAHIVPFVLILFFILAVVLSFFMVLRP